MNKLIILILLFVFNISINSQTKVGVWEGFDIIDSAFGGQICYGENDTLIDCEFAQSNFHGNIIYEILSSDVDIELYGVKFLTFSERDWYNIDHIDHCNGIVKMIEESMNYFDSKGCEYVNISIGTNKKDLKRYVSGYYRDSLGSLRVYDYTDHYLFNMEMAYRRAFSSHPNITFVLSAGNEGSDVDSIYSIPATLYDFDNVVVLQDDDSYSNTCKKCTTYFTCDYNLDNHIYSGTSLCTPYWINSEIRSKPKK